MITLITRHPATQNLLREIFPQEDVQVISHLREEDIPSLGDVVVGVLPLPMIAKILEAGKRFFLFSVAVPPELRGKELTEEDLKKLGWSLYEVKGLQLEEVRK